MNWLKTLWDKAVSKTSVSPKLSIVEEDPTPVEVEEEHSVVGELLRQVLLSEKVGAGTIAKHNIVEIFEEWYDGPADATSIRDSIPDFCNACGGVINAKLNKIK